MYKAKLPLVSICLPTFNGAKWIRKSVNSALGQTYENIEIIVVDDGSTDDTVKQIRSIDDPRITVHTNGRNIGLIRNWNKCLKLARGEYIKFLFQDDILYPDCVERMMSLFFKYDGIGLVFSARDILVDLDLDDKTAQRWLEYCEVLHTHFDSLSEFNSGRSLFLQLMRSDFYGNWIGEPSSALVRKECFERLGGFNARLFQIGDLEMWLRIIYFYNVGFIEDRLNAFRIHDRSKTVANTRNHDGLFDQLWLFEELLRHKEIRDDCPEIVVMRDRELDRQKILMIRPFLAWSRLANRNGVKQAIEDLKCLPSRARFFLLDYPAYKLRGYL